MNATHKTISLVVVFHIDLEKGKKSLIEHGNAKFVCLGIPPFPIKKRKKIRRNFCSFASVL
jgi:hypothetical protein